MPERQQTQGDFGYRPVKPQQQITDTYSTPQLPKPDLSVLEGIGKLSDTAFTVMDFQQKQEKFQKEAGKELGEAQPEFKIGRGTTEAAMAGFEEGRGVALRDRFRKNAVEQWNMEKELNENLNLAEDYFPQFLMEQESKFIQENKLEGLALNSFNVGREDWYLENINTNNLNSIKYRKTIFKTDMKESTSAALGMSNNINESINFLQPKDVFNYLQNSLVDENDNGQTVTLTDKDGNVTFSKSYKDITESDLTNVGVALEVKSRLNAEYATTQIAPRLQEVLDRGYQMGGAVQQEVNKAVAADLITALESGVNPEVVQMVAEKLTLGTGRFVDTNEYLSKYEESREGIEKNILDKRYGYLRQMDMFTLSESLEIRGEQIAGATTEERVVNAINMIRNNVGDFLTQEQGLALEQTILRNFDSEVEHGTTIQKTAEFARIASLGDESSRNLLSASQIKENLTNAGYKNITERKVINGVEDALYVDASTNPNLKNDNGTRNFAMEADYISEVVMENGVFTNQTVNNTSHIINNASDNMLRRTAIDSLDSVEGVRMRSRFEQAFYLYSSFEQKDGLNRLSLADRTVATFDYLQTQLGLGLTFEEAIAKLPNVNLSDNIVVPTNKEVQEYITDKWGGLENYADMPDMFNLFRDTAVSLLRETPSLGVEKALERAEKMFDDSNIVEVNGRPLALPMGANLSQQEKNFVNGGYELINNIGINNLLQQYKDDHKEVNDIFTQAVKDGLINEEMFAAEYWEDFKRADGTVHISRWSFVQMQGVKDAYKEEVYNLAIDMFRDKHDRLPLPASGSLDGTGLEDFDLDEKVFFYQPDINISLQSRGGNEGTSPTYYFVNTETGAPITVAGYKANYTIEQLMETFDEDYKKQKLLKEQHRDSFYEGTGVRQQADGTFDMGSLGGA